MSYSQNNEEEVILNYFKDIKGNFLDIGAASGIELSNTRQLLENGWKGVLVEPSCYILPALIKHTQGYDAEIVNAVIGTETGWKKWYESGGDFLSTTNESHVQLWSEVKFTPQWVYQVSYLELKAKYGDVFDFINIDVEGNSAELFLKMFTEFPNCKMWCIEHDGRKEEILNLAKDFKEVLFNGENLVIAK